MLLLQSAGFSAASDATRVSVIIGLFKVCVHVIIILKLNLAVEYAS